MLMKNTIVALWILGSIASPTAMARNLRGGESEDWVSEDWVSSSDSASSDNGPEDLDYSYNYYWTQTGSNQYYRGSFKQAAPEGWIPLTWGADGPPSESKLIEGFYNGPDDWVSWSDSASLNWGPNDRKLDYAYNYYWTQTGSNRYYRGNFIGDAPDGWIQQTWGAEGPPPTEGEWIEAKWNKNEPAPEDWVSWSDNASSDDGPEDPKLDYSYNYYWTKTGSNRYYRGYFKQGAPEGWIKQTWGAEGPPPESGLIEGTWSEDESDDWVSWSDSAFWDNSRSVSEDGP